jgi:hypothetical protein
LEDIFKEKAKVNLKAGGQSRELLKQPLHNSAKPLIQNNTKYSKEHHAHE